MASTLLFFPKNLKSRATAGGFAPRLPVCDTLELHWPSQNVSKVTYLHFFNYISLSALPLENPG